MFRKVRAWFSARWFALRKWWYVRRGINLNTWPGQPPRRPSGAIGIGGHVVPPPPLSKESLAAYEETVRDAYARGAVADETPLPFPPSPLGRVTPPQLMSAGQIQAASSSAETVFDRARAKCLEISALDDGARLLEWRRLRDTDPSFYQLVRSQMNALRRQASSPPQSS